MEKEKILELAKKDNKRACEYENHESIKSLLLGNIITVVLGIILFFSEYLTNKHVNVSLIVLALSIMGVQPLYEGCKTKKVRLIIWGILNLIFMFFSLLIFILQVIKK